MSGAGTPVTTQAMTMDINIDSLLYGTKWNSYLINYTTPDSAGDYQVGYTSTPGVDTDIDNDGNQVLSDSFSQLNSAQTIALQSALDADRYTGTAPGGSVFAVEGFTNLLVTFAGAGSGVGTIRVANASDVPAGYAGYASPPDATYPYHGGDVFIDGSFGTIATPRAGNHGWHTMYHEVGHALGFKHAHEPDVNTAVLPVAVDGQEFSIMTYRTAIGDSSAGTYDFDTWSAPQSFMMLDILALQTMYGANYSTNNGNTIYTWDPTNGKTYINGQVAIDPGANRVFATIWDGGGSDKYDLSNYSTNLSINLNPGEFSTFSSGQLATLVGGTAYARGNIANALLYGGNTASLIENVEGGTGNDTITGNVVNNVLRGNNGHDTLYGLDGSDGLYGGDGNDILDGGASNDVMSGGTGNDTYYVDNVNDIVSESSGAGTDIIYTVSSFSLTSTSYVETIIANGSSSINLDGSSSSQRIEGNSGNNRINGGDGSDTLRGNAGTDTFTFSTAPSLGNKDIIEDYQNSVEKLELSRSAYTALNPGSSLNASAFRIGSGALDSDDRIIYNNLTGSLYYDSDGSGATARIEFATIGAGLVMTASNFVLIA